MNVTDRTSRREGPVEPKPQRSDTERRMLFLLYRLLIISYNFIVRGFFCSVFVFVLFPNVLDDFNETWLAGSYFSQVLHLINFWAPKISKGAKFLIENWTTANVTKFSTVSCQGRCGDFYGVKAKSLLAQMFSHHRSPYSKSSTQNCQFGMMAD